MALFEVGVLVLILGLILTMVIVLFIVFFIFTHFDKKYMKKISEISAMEDELRENLSKVNDARGSSNKDIIHRIDVIEQKLEVLLQPEGEAKELSKEKIRAWAHAKK